jgi:ABC-type dipeptide/oligopeptide/nickel transport system permease subunit
MLALIVCAAFAPLLAAHDPTRISMLGRRIAPFEELGHPLETDIMGRDMLSRLIYGARTSVFISLVALGTELLWAACLVWWPATGPGGPMS